MSHLLILEFENVGKDLYDAVNSRMGLDPNGRTDWPDGIESHAAGTSDDGNLVVTEIWDTREAQAAFMEGRLGPALHDADAPAPSRVTWVELLVDNRL